MRSSEVLLHPTENPVNFAREGYQIHARTADLSFPARIPESSLASPDVTIARFILWTHVPENQSEVLPLLEGCQVLALEAFVSLDGDETPAELQREAVINKQELDLLSIVVTGSYDESTAERLLEYGINPQKYVAMPYEERLQIIEATVQPYYVEILKESMDKVEKIYFIDVQMEDATTLARLEAIEQARAQALSRALITKKCAWDDLPQLVLDRARATMQTNQFREGITKLQLEHILPENSGKVIGILQGRIHRSQTRLVEVEMDQSVIFQRQFPRNKQEVDPWSIKMNALYHAIEDLLRVGIEDNETLGDLIDGYLVLRYASIHGSEDALRAVGAMSETELGRLVPGIAATFAGGGRWSGRRSKRNWGHQQEHR